MNIKIYLIYVISTLLILTSCNPPKITKNVLKKSQETSMTMPFVIYKSGEEVPKQTEILGTLTITDETGSTHLCQWHNIVEFAETEVKQAGGNALLLTTHYTPSVWGSNCHQIEGIILNVLDTTKEEEINYGLVAANNKRTDSIENKEDTAKTKIANSEKKPVNDTSYIDLEKINFEILAVDSSGFRNIITFKPKKMLPKFIFKADVGYGWRIAPINENLDAASKKFLEELTSGFVWNASADIFFNDLIVLGYFVINIEALTKRLFII